MLSVDMRWRRVLGLIGVVVVVGLVAGGVTSCGTPPPAPPEVIRETVIVEETVIVPGTPEPSGEPIKIGMVFSFTGPGAYSGETNSRGATMAAEEINAEGGILGHPVALVACDNEGTLEKSIACVRRLIELDDVDLIIGMSSSGQVLASKDILQEYEVPFVTLMCSSAKITEDAGRAGGNTWVFRFPPHDGMMAEAFAGFVGEQVDSVCMMATNDDFGRGGVEVTIPFLQAAGVEVLVDDYHEVGESDFRPVITRWKGLNCEGMYLIPWSKDAATFINQARELGFEAQVFSRDAMSTPEFMEGLSDASFAEGIMEVGQVLTNAEPEFQQQFLTRWGKLPHDYAASAYVGVRYVAAEAFRTAIEETGEATRSSIRDALETLSVETLYFGLIEFDEYNQAHPDIPVKLCENGEWRVLEYIAVAD
ncbi:MAG: ABC transporter substrate-binding protein [Anaerolineae bacterium]